LWLLAKISKVETIDFPRGIGKNIGLFCSTSLALFSAVFFLSQQISISISVKPNFNQTNRTYIYIPPAVQAGGGST
jgi:hypothetical protein